MTLSKTKGGLMHRTPVRLAALALALPFLAVFPAAAQTTGQIVGAFRTEGARGGTA